MQITLPVRFFRAVPSRTPDGYITETWNLDLSKTAFVSLHAWNVGCPGGPPVPEEYWVDMGSPQNHEVGWRIITGEIVPALAAARRTGMNIVHVQSESIGRKYPHLMPPMPEERRAAVDGPPDAKIPTLEARRRMPISDHYSQRASRVHGEGFMNWDGWKDLDFAEPLRPLPNETVVISTEQWDDWLREKGIDTLIYVGFCTNLCILDAPGGMRLMAPLGYRCVILREATLAVEFPETLEQRLQTQASLRHIEAWVGYTAASQDFLRACESAK
jgi:nicotinamidase-related amidase